MTGAERMAAAVARLREVAAAAALSRSARRQAESDLRRWVGAALRQGIKPEDLTIELAWRPGWVRVVVVGFDPPEESGTTH